MKIFKVILALFSFCLFSVSMQAQGFASFKVEGALFDTSIQSAKKGASKVEVVVGEDVDLKNVKSKYALLGGNQMDGKLTNDFTNPQTVEIYKAATGKEWIVQVKKLQAAPLPLELNFSNSNPSIYDSSSLGWVTFRTDESKPSVVRFGNHGVSFIVAFDGEAKDVSYDLTVVGAKGTEFDGVFDIEVSSDAKTWKPLASYTSKKPFSTDSSFTNEIPEGVRYIKWTYKEREKQNVNLNNIKVSLK